MQSLGPVLTAAVTPFDEDGRVDDDAFVSLLHHLKGSGSDGAVIAGTTGEASTLSHEEHLELVGLAVRERPDGFAIVAGAGSNNTREAVHLTEQSCALGADAILSVNPYYNRPSRKGIVAHYREVSRAADRPVLLYNIPHRTGSDMPNDLLAELAQLDHIDGVKQANTANLALIDGLELLAGNDEDFAAVLDMGGSGGILTASHLAGQDFRRMVDEPSERAAIEASLQPLFRALSVAPLAASIKAGLNLMGVRAGTPRLPYVPLDPDEVAPLEAALRSRGLVGARA